MTPSCCIVNLSSRSADWISCKLLGVESLPLSDPPLWSCTTKYYTATVHLHSLDLAQVLESRDNSTDSWPANTEALILYCDTTKESFNDCSKVWEIFGKHGPPVCLCVVEKATDQVTSEKELTRTAILDWCLTHHFELVECDETPEEEEEEDQHTDSDIPAERVGRDRIAEALESHTWSNMVVSQQAAPSTTTRVPLPDNGDKPPGTDTLEAECDSFESLFAQLASIKQRSANLPDDERRSYAEKMALAFYAAMGQPDSEETMSVTKFS
uniref:Alpha-and gamma-adaptin-binding protein p34-like protein n=1 Tax=Pseudodiaptomus poplesia TaxID=213370 RepID=A0A1S6GL57_9MAXI|nr:alpha- and gamma-adaptin-binding protein p34-like protein [Pseudodiaptomus poplesia]